MQESDGRPGHPREAHQRGAQGPIRANYTRVVPPPNEGDQAMSEPTGESNPFRIGDEVRRRGGVRIGCCR